MIIKADYLLQSIFSFVDDKKKLKIVQNSKKFQKRLDINIMNYRQMSAKFFIGERNGIGKEYNYDGHLIFEGEYKNGKKNGKGKEYEHDLILNKKLKFEGEYLNGLKHGKGKEYYEQFPMKKPIVIFDGEYLNGKKNGKAKEYYNDGKLKFDGEYNKGKIWNGKGYDKYGNNVYEIKDGKGHLIEYDNNTGTLIYEGDIVNGEKNGSGYETNCYNKILFKGEYLNGVKWNGIFNFDKKYELTNGKGHIKENKEKDRIFEGEYINGKPNGSAYIKIFNSRKYEFKGELKDGKMHGKGSEYNDNQLLFEGEYTDNYKKKGKLYVEGKLEFDGEFFLNKKWNGKGYNKEGNVIYELINGNGNVKEYDDCNEDLIFEGEYKDGFRTGKGIEYSCGRKEFEGEYSNGLRNGKGKEYLSGENICFEGEYKDGLRNGKGKEYYNDGNIEFEDEDEDEDEYSDDKECNKEKEYYGKLKYEGEYLNGKRNGEGKEYYIDGQLKFEGKYLADKKWDGKGYYKNNEIIYELKEGKGYIKEYKDNYEIDYECEMINGEKNGNSKEYISGRLFFEGEYKNGIRNGKGREYDKDGEIKFEGDFVNGECKGYPLWDDYR